MATISPSLLFTTKEWAYLMTHVGWKPPDMQRIVAICILESQLHTGAYRPESANPLGGRDMSAAMINDKAWPVQDPFVRFDAITTCREALRLYNTAQLKPWGYPGKRNDGNINLAAVAAEIGPNPYDITASPYWRMKAAGIDTWDLLVPPANLYVSNLPPAPLRYNTGGAPPDPIGVAINSLQRVLKAMGRFPGNLDYWYGPRVRDGIASIQRDLTASNLWTGLTDGKLFSVELRTVWDGVYEAQYAFDRGTLE